MGEILESDPEIAHDWLRCRVEEGVIIGMDDDDGEVGRAISILNRPQRLSVLRSVRPTSMYTTLVRNLIGNDLDLYRVFLQDENLTSVHLWPLTARPTGLWSEKAKLAMNAGFSASDVAEAAYSGDMGWIGSEYAMWRGWIEQWRSLCSHPDGGVRSAAQYGLRYAQQREQEAAEQERQEDIYGR